MVDQLTWKQQVRTQQQSEQIFGDFPHSRSAVPLRDASNTKQEFRTVANASTFDRLALRRTVKQSLVSKEKDAKHREAIEAAENTESVAPVELGNDEAGDERAKIRADQEGEAPDVDLASTLMEEEHVMDHGKTDNLWRRAKEALESTHRSEGCIVVCVCCTNGADQREKLGPEQDGETTEC